MNTIRFIQMSLNELNRSFVNEIKELTPEQMFYRPTAEANHIAFLVWHFPRVEDNTWHRVATPEGGPPIWVKEEWHKKFGLAEKDSGTGFEPDQVSALKPDKDLLISYVERVGEAVWEGVGKLTDDDLDRPLREDDPRLTVGRQIQSIILGHGYFHLGEVRFLKGLQGMPFAR